MINRTEHRKYLIEKSKEITKEDLKIFGYKLSEFE